MRLVSAAGLLVAFALVVAGCGGDNLALCNGCTSPTPAASLTETPTPTPVATPTATPIL